MIGIGIIIIIGTVIALFVFNSKAEGADGGEPVQGATVLDGMKKFAQAISKAEGFGLPGAIPTLANNPGDLKIPGWTGESLGTGVSVFQSDTIDNPVAPDGGWARLFHQLSLIMTGDSQVYSPDDTISEMADKWTTTNPEDWANNVANFLGVSTDTPIGELLTQ